MRKLIFITAFFATFFTRIKAQDYAVSGIAKDLLSYASAVTRVDETTITIKDNENVLYHIKYVVTVLNKNGDDEAQLELWHTKQRQIKYVKGIIYDEFGKPTGKISESDFKDVSNFPDYSLFQDDRVKYYTPTVTTYPYTIAYEYELRSNQTLNVDSWTPAGSAGLAVEKSVLNLVCKPDFKFRYKETNYPGQVTTTEDKGIKTYTWQMGNLKARRAEPYSPYKLNYITSVRITPQSFTYDGFTGSYTNWDELGKWTYDKLLNGRAQLPPETVRQMKDLTADISDPKAKARKIYEYMQNKTRYVSIQIGIGGYQPFAATEVDQLSYGDCKGLVNYTQALLKAVNIDSYYCVVEAGSEKISLKPDYASMDQGNHIILCLPFKSDTTWLECTSKTLPFGYLGNFTDDRWVLACTPQGGKLLHTPKYTAQENREEIKANFNVNEKGELKGDIITNATGTQYENEEDMLTESFQDQLKHIQKQYPISNMDVVSFKFGADKSIKPVLTESVKFNAVEYALADSGKLRFTVNSVNRLSNVPREIRNRANPLYINRGYTDEDVITYTLPEGYHADRTLLNIKLQKEFGNYTASVTVKGNQLIYSRKMQLIDGTYSKDAYSEFVDFYQAVADADSYNVTVVKDK